MKNYIQYLTSALITCLLFPLSSIAQKKQSEQLSTRFIEAFPKNDLANTYAKEKAAAQEIFTEGLTAVWRNTADGDYFKYIQAAADARLDKNNHLKNLSPDEIEEVGFGRSLLLLYKVTGQQKYLNAATGLFNQLQKYPRTQEGIFIHGQKYPDQVWLNDLYAVAPFYTEYAALMEQDAAFAEVARLFTEVEKKTLDTKTGLLYHAWDGSKEAAWASKSTGTSGQFWAPAIGYYLTALVDVLDYFPENHPQKAALTAILNRTAAAVLKQQDPKTGIWFNIINQPAGKAGFADASASALFVYSFAKAVRKGYLPEKFRLSAQKGYTGLTKTFIQNADGNLSLTGNTVYAEPGNSFAHYQKNPVKNSLQAAGAIILAATEIEAANATKAGKGLTVTLDNYFNNEYKTGPTGKKIPFHYHWNEEDNNGFSFFGRVFNKNGVATKTLKDAPTSQNLENSQIYIIVDPDTEKETEKPNYMNAAHAAEIAGWVKKGGVLVLLLNDVGNCEITKFNTLPELFGIHFNEDSRNKVPGDDFEMGAIQIQPGNSIFKTARKIYIKEISTLQVKNPATPALTDQGDVIIATAKYGKGTVFAVGDPWFYNEYIDGRKLPKSFHNFEATNDLVNWLIREAKK